MYKRLKEIITMWLHESQRFTLKSSKSLDTLSLIAYNPGLKIFERTHWQFSEKKYISELVA